MKFQAFWQKNIPLLLVGWCFVAFLFKPGWPLFIGGIAGWLLLLYLTAPAVFWNYIAALNPDPVKAEPLLKRSAKSGASFAQPYVALSMILGRQKRWEEVITSLEKAVIFANKKLQPQLRVHLAAAHREMGSFVTARTILEELISQNHQTMPLYINLARVYQQLGLLPEALDAAEKARSFDLSNTQPVLIAARIQFAMGDFPAAKNNFEWAISHLSWPVETYYWLGRSELELGELQNAFDHLTTAVERIIEDPLLSDVPANEAQEWLDQTKQRLQSSPPETSIATT